MLTGIKKIYFLVANMGIGGTQRVTITLARWLLQKEITVKIIAVGGFKNQYVIPMELNYVCLEHTSNKNYLKTVSKLRKIIKNEQPDILITMGVPVGLFSVPAVAGLKTRHILSERNDPGNFMGKPIVGKISQGLMRFGDGFIFQTEDALKYYNSSIQKRGTVIPNPILANNIPDARSYEKKKKIVTMGRLIPQKNHSLLISAFNIFLQKHPDYELHIFGSGEMRESLLNSIRQLGIASKVVHHEACNDVLEKIADAQMFVLSSNFEGMPNALMEAMAMGLPCISTDCPCGGPRFLIQDGVNGFLVPLNDQNKMAKKMRELAEDSDLRARISIEAGKIKEQLDTQTICGHWYDYCSKVWSGNSL